MATQKKNGSKYGSKTAFILGFDLDVPAKEVMAKAKEQGIVFDEKYVYGVRTMARAKARDAAPKPVVTNHVAEARLPEPPRALPEPKIGDDVGDAERAFTRLVLDIGRPRAEALFRRVMANLEAIEGSTERG